MAENPKETQEAFQFELMNLYGYQRNPDDLLRIRGDKIYEDMLRDEQVKVVSSFRKNSIVSRGWFFEYEEDVEIEDTEKDSRIREMTEMFQAMPGSFRTILRSIMSSIDFGFSLTEKQFHAVDIGGKVLWGPKTLKTKPFNTFIFDVDDFGNLLGIVQESGSREIPLNPKDFIHHVHNADRSEYYGQSELKEAFRSWFSKDNIIKLENIHLERLAGGFIWVGREEKSASLKGQAKIDFEAALRNINAKTGMSMPAGYELHLENPTATTAFADAKSWHDKAISKALLMPNLLGFSEQGSVGSYSQSQTQLEAFLWMLDSEAEDLEETLNEQLISDLGRFNYADGLAPRLKLKELSESLKQAVISIWGDLIQKGAVTKTDTDEAYLRELIDFPEKGEPDQEPLPDENQEVPANEEPKEENDEDPASEEGETVMGAATIDIEYNNFTRASERVNFTRIKESTESAEEKAVESYRPLLVDAIDGVIAKFKELDVLSNVDNVGKVKIPSSITSKIRRRSNTMLNDAWTLGATEARGEVQVAKEFTKQAFSRFAAIGDVAQDFFNSKSFFITGSLTREIELGLQNAILQGIKYSRNEKEVVEDFMRAMETRGLADPDQFEDIMEVALDTTTPLSRLRTIVRNNMFESINESRFNLFTDPELTGFVESLEYSAILDSRVTSICKHLNGRVYAATSDTWDRYRPPNHHNCRSILIAVTTLDSIPVTQELPSIEPQEGFA